MLSTLLAHTMSYHVSLDPICGTDIHNLQSTLTRVFCQGDGLNGTIRSLDTAMLMNIPPARIPNIAKARGGGPVSHNDEDSTARVIRPSQAILTRLLERYPHYAPLIPMPSPVELWAQIRPLIPSWLCNERHPEPSSIIFGPLFGRSYPTSYKLLGSRDNPGVNTSEPPTNVMRLFMLTLEKLGQIFRDSLLAYLDDNAPASVRDHAASTMKSNWLVLKQTAFLIDAYVPASYRQTFNAEVLERKRAWFDLYLQVVCDEAISRHLDPRDALTRGHWRTQRLVSNEDFRSLHNRRQHPITGADQDVFKRIRNLISARGGSAHFSMSSAEFFWILGMPMKAYYAMRSNPEQYIDAATSILVRYLSRYIDDVKLLLLAPGDGHDVLDAIRQIDPDFRIGHLAPLFGGSYVSSYLYAKNDTCPADLHRLTGIFMREVTRNPDIYYQIRQCTEEEAYARGIDRQTFWQQSRWSIPEAVIDE